MLFICMRATMTALNHRNLTLGREWVWVVTYQYALALYRQHLAGSQWRARHKLHESWFCLAGKK
jgi:hypothetical protein